VLFESDPADVRRVGMPQSKPLLDTHPVPGIRPEIDPPRIRRMGEFVRRGNRGRRQRRQRRRHLRRRLRRRRPGNLSAQQPFSQTNLLLTFIFTDRSFYL